MVRICTWYTNRIILLNTSASFNKNNFLSGKHFEDFGTAKKQSYVFCVRVFWELYCVMRFLIHSLSGMFISHYGDFIKGRDYSNNLLIQCSLIVWNTTQPSVKSHLRKPEFHVYFLLNWKNWKEVPSQINHRREWVLNSKWLII